MKNEIPSNWRYSANLENLFFFYQAAEEMLSSVSPDTYRHTVHNTLSLCEEIELIYNVLSESMSLDTYYSKYIPVIIDELIESIHHNKVIKNKLGLRLDSIITGLEAAKKNRAILIRWIRLIYQTCTMKQYCQLCQEEITRLVQLRNGKKELLFYTNDYLVSLIKLGYNEEYLHSTLVHYFESKTRDINSPSDLNGFFELLDFSKKEIELYIIADTYLNDVFVKRVPFLEGLMEITSLEEDKIIPLTSKSRSVAAFYENYNRLKNRESISMISYKTKTTDPFNALEKLDRYFGLLQILNGYYKHKSEKQLYFDVLYKASDTWFYYVRSRGVIPKRPFIKDDTIDQRVLKILNASTLSEIAFDSFFSALSKHLDAISCRNEETMLLTFWTAIESIFYEPVIDGDRDNAINSLSHIIEKTYLLKIFRILYSQIVNAISIDDLRNLNIGSFEQFMFFFAQNQHDSEQFKVITDLLKNNPLLRSRIYNLRKELRDSKHIREKIMSHNQRIKWQILRIYRTRNLITHVGKTMPYSNEILFNLHNYFDYVVNYIICKIENDDYVMSISSLVFEAKNDNQLFMESLKKDDILNENNYKQLLFGSDQNLLNYDFEVADFPLETFDDVIVEEKE